MADGILGLGSTGSVNLNDELIEKLKSKESEARLDPIKKNEEKKQAEIDAVEEIYTKTQALLDAVDDFDLYTTGTNAFDQVAASTSGTAASFDATDTSGLSPGSIDVTVTQLATKDVYQSDIISDKAGTIGTGSITVTVGGESHEFTIDADTTYEDLVSDMNYYSDFEASLEQVGDDSYRLVIKSAESGTANAVTISQTDVDLGYDDEQNNHVITSQNFVGTIDGVSYNTSSNQVTLNSGLIVTATAIGDASITISKDTSAVQESIEGIATAYNELIDLYKKYTTYDEAEDATVISDSSVLDSVINSIKNMFYSDYGLEDEENTFSYGISFNSDGEMEIDSSELAEALNNNFDDLKELFVGYAEKEGIGTKLTAYIDDLDGFEGTLTTYMENLSDNLDELKEEYEEESNKLDEKYQQMADQFAAYTVIITQMEQSFQSLKLLIGADDDE